MTRIRWAGHLQRTTEEGKPKRIFLDRPGEEGQKETKEKMVGQFRGESMKTWCPQVEKSDEGQKGLIYYEFIVVKQAQLYMGCSPEDGWMDINTQKLWLLYTIINSVNVKD